MRRAAIVVAVLVMAGLANQTASAEEAVAGAPAAAELQAPSAHNPCFDQAGLWPEDVKKTAYYQQKWEPARLLVWAMKGEYWSDPANWLEYLPDGSGGKPAETIPDENTDVLFPDGTYKVALAGQKGWPEAGNLEVRHLTVGNGVDLYLRLFTATGNVWIRQGCRWRVTECIWRGGKDTFSRSDMEKQIAFKIPVVIKHDNRSVEVLGRWGCVDGLSVNSGKLIIGPDSSWLAGNRHQNIVAPKAALVLMSGARYNTHFIKYGAWDLDVYGELLAGTPERPLQKDALFPLGWKSRGREVMNNRVVGDDRDGGLMVRPDARLAVHSADPKRARLVFRQLRDEDLANSGKRTGPALNPAHKHVQMFLLGKTELNGVEFNDMDLGGIELAEPTVRDQWKNIQYGPSNAGKPDELFKKYAGKMPREYSPATIGKEGHVL
jgi:hypothetical protein